MGVARLVLGPGLHAVTVVRLGLEPDTLHVRLDAATDTTVDVVLRERSIELALVIVASTRAERRIEDEPERVEVLAGEDVDEKSQTRPGDVTTLVREIAGVRLQTTAPASGAAGLRIQGLRAQYSTVLVDGLPLHGAEGVGLGLLQIPPLDVQQAEVIKGAVTALYGPSAIGGVLDIVTRRPGDATERKLLVNQSSRGGTDGALWLSRRLDEHWGVTFLGGVHRQVRTDVNHDGWADLAGYDRVELRPRLFWSGDGGRSLMATVGTTLEDREGGGDDGELRRRAETRHVDAGLNARLPFGEAGVFMLRAAWGGDWLKDRVFDPLLGAVPLRSDQQTGFTEVTWLAARGSAVWLLGAAGQLEHHRNADLPRLDYRFTNSSALGQVTWTAAPWLSSSSAVRLDAHGRYGTHVSPRVSLLAHAAHRFEARLSAGSGFHAPSPFNEETSALPPTRIQPPARLEAERARSLSLDLTTRRGALELNATGFLSRIENPVLLAEPADTVTNPTAFASLFNATGPTRTGGYEVYAFYTKEPITVTANYSWLRAAEAAPDGRGRREVPLTPRHSAGLDVAWDEDESGTRAGLELFYTGRQSLEHDPYRKTSAPYATIGVLVSQRVGRALLYVNGENLADIRQTRYEPMLLPQPTPAGRLTVDSWAPAEGWTVNGGATIRF